MTTFNYPELIKQKKRDFDSVFEHVRGEVAAIRTGRANSAMVEDIQVEYMGSKMRIKEMIKLLGQKVEEARIKSRHIREDILKKVQLAVKEKTAREDDLHKAKDELQKIMDDFNKKLDELSKKKEQELMG